MAQITFHDILKNRDVRNLVIVGAIAKVPPASLGVVITLHVVNTLGLNYTKAGIAVMVFTAGEAIAGPWRGRMLDNRGMRYTLLPSIIIEALIWPTLALVDFHFFVPLIFIAGLFCLPIFTIMRQCLSVMVESVKQRTAFALDSVTTDLIWMVAPALGTIIAVNASSRIALVSFGLFSSLAGIILWVINPPTTSGKPRSEKVKVKYPSLRAKYSWLTWPLLGVLMLSFASGLVLSSTDVSIIAHLQKQDKVDQTWLVFMLWCAASATGGIIYGKVRRKISPALLVALLGFFTMFCAFSTTPLVLALLTIPAGIVCAPALTVATEVTAANVAEERRGEAMGWQGSALTIGTSLGSPVAGIFIDSIGSWSGFFFPALIAIGVAVLGGVMLRKIRYSSFGN
ncbi:MAG: MFS transporter [Micrococcaceae bacterium]